MRVVRARKASCPVRCGFPTGLTSCTHVFHPVGRIVVFSRGTTRRGNCHRRETFSITLRLPTPFSISYSYGREVFVVRKSYPSSGIALEAKPRPETLSGETQEPNHTPNMHKYLTPVKTMDSIDEQAFKGKQVDDSAPRRRNTMTNQEGEG